MMIILSFFLGCQNTAKTPPIDDSEAHQDSVDSTDTQTSLPFSITIPANTSSAGNDLADQCPYVMSVDYECYNPNPEVRWEGLPEGTAALALVFDDPDARDFDHWAVVNIPASEAGLATGISGEGISPQLPGAAYQLQNGFGFDGYLGSCPPAPHVYRWRLWALSAPLETGLSQFREVEQAAEAASLGLAETCHIYGPASR